MNVMFVKNYFHGLSAFRAIKEHTLERNLMNVMFVKNNFLILPAY